MPNPAPLLFIDTNIFLDFYRATGSQDFKLLDRLKEIQVNLITTLQVEMEFQKNRQKLMQESFRKLALRERPEIPGLFANSKEATKLNAATKQIEKSLGALKKRLSAAMKAPAKYDPVYKAAKSVFSFKSEFNLDRTKEERHQIRELAQKRFLLGTHRERTKTLQWGMP